MPKEEVKIYPVLLAGGIGSRLWPVSRELFPKQLVNLAGDDSLIQDTIKRLSPVLDIDNVRIVCGDDHYYEVLRHLEEINVSSDGKVISEPCGRNTAPAILLAVLSILKNEKDAVILVFPSDHVISDQTEFHESLQKAVDLANMDKIVTFGIKPNYPETGYGYIEGGKSMYGDSFAVRRFVEKPDEKTARRYLKAGNFFWNSGMFAFKASVVIKEFQAYEPGILKGIKKIVSKGDSVPFDLYEKIPDISIDYAIMEKTKKGVVLPSDFGWSDIGSWKSLYDFLPKGKDNNVIEGDVILQDTRNSFVRSENRLVVTNSIENIVIVDTPDTVFVSSLEESRNVKSVVNKLKKLGRKEFKSHVTVYRPWGTYTILEENNDSKIKRIVVYPGAKLSLQMHYHRSEHWIVAQGTAKITNGDQVFILKENESTFVPKTNRHRLENPGSIPLHIIEVQMGKYLGEDDIVRFDDDFGRTVKAKKKTAKKKVVKKKAVKGKKKKGK
ncbi:MAG TPA: mannose-1-phosphate guanylyltransferase/mannose-6-phosphate isomerase [Nitrospirae bacterium]|nr:alginate biosynthesis protein AlgA [bacterium BMS3Abin09]GBE40744.1 alginate biosynthesis protein AlgA [bacterium BMS3Bbin09]HDH34587.1 mannose-1-phosphate guanylyltransferase/mannose-6-phosphate isomerase [Nitrospirota bacterium]HDO66854.1 mannose-1-phosphate guanylyltransferase/mannose-6-phosphate isomerase [Nitrospirota bacterium]HDZ84428.1 mannose-1-phosphate guanylyltransferase/mannose-6-phosphate isomerase [Nitrospirota bacterium]